MLKILAVAGAIVIVVLGVGAYVLGSSALAAGAAEANANTTLESVRSDIDGIGTSLTTPSLDTTTTDYAKSKQTTDQLVTQLDQARATIARDQPRLGSARDRLVRQSTGLPALPFRAALEHQRLRVDSIRGALGAADTALGIEAGQARTVSALFDASAEFDTLTTRLQAQDLAGSLALFPGLNAKLQTAVRLGQAPDNPPQIQKMLKDMQTTSSDMQAYLQAVQRRDRNALPGLEKRLTADTTAIQNFDEAGMVAYQRTLMQPYKDRYDSGVRAAGFTPTG
jgi:uncharacterized protein YukE